MKAQDVIKRLLKLNDDEEDVLLIEGEAFYVRKASPKDVKAVKESIKVKGGKQCEK